MYGAYTRSHIIELDQDFLLAHMDGRRIYGMFLLLCIQFSIESIVVLIALWAVRVGQVIHFKAIAFTKDE